MVLVRRLLGDVLRRQRQRQGRTLREVSAVAQVSLGYLSEVERGQKEASSELLASICAALDVPLSEILREVSTDLESIEARVLANAARTNAVAGQLETVPAIDDESVPELDSTELETVAHLHDVVAA